MLVVVNAGVVANLDILRAGWTGNRFAGLFQNPDEPMRLWTIGTIIPATFSGYSGLKPLVNWLPAVISGDFALTSADLLTWTMTGTTVTNWVFGYYVVDSLGQLCWAERKPGPGSAMVNTGNFYQVKPQFSLSSRFPQE